MFYKGVSVGFIEEFIEAFIEAITVREVDAMEKTPRDELEMRYLNNAMEIECLRDVKIYENVMWIMIVK